MPAPNKKGLDYYSHDVDMSWDDKVEYMEAIHGVIGYAIYNKLLEKIYSKGFYLAWDKRAEAKFAKRLNVDLTTVQAVIATCIKEELFSKKVFTDKGILTSSGIQRRFLKATWRRKILAFRALEDHADINCLEVNEYINLVNENINGVNVALTEVNVGNNPQSKVKESKVKEKKGKGRGERKGKRSKKKKKKGVYRGSGLTLRQFKREEKGWNELLDQLQENKTPRGVSRYEKLIAEGIEKGFKRREKK